MNWLAGNCWVHMLINGAQGLMQVSHMHVIAANVDCLPRIADTQGGHTTNNSLGQHCAELLTDATGPTRYGVSTYLMSVDHRLVSVLPAASALPA